jgi:DNA-binding PadR family transcriptional regulator
MDTTTPLRPAALHVLLALADGPLHGYGILQAVRDRGGADARLGTGSLYRHLSTLIDGGLVAESTTPRASATDPRRGTHYRLTPRGQRVLAAERDRLASLVAAIDAWRASSPKSHA